MLKDTQCICCKKHDKCIKIESKGYQDYFTCKICTLNNIKILKIDGKNKKELKELINEK